LAKWHTSEIHDSIIASHLRGWLAFGMATCDIRSNDYAEKGTARKLLFGFWIFSAEGKPVLSIFADPLGLSRSAPLCGV
jgi:hypothetical protein